MKFRKVLNETLAVAGGMSMPMAIVYAAGEMGISAVGLTTGIAAVGAGSMFVGVGVIALIGIGTYQAVNWVLDYEEASKSTNS